MLMSPDLIGYVASGLVLLTFTARSMLTLRILAIISNFAFIGYGIADSIIPVLCLHAAAKCDPLGRVARISKARETASLSFPLACPGCRRANRRPERRNVEVCIIAG